MNIESVKINFNNKTYQITFKKFENDKFFSDKNFEKEYIEILKK